MVRLSAFRFLAPPLCLVAFLFTLAAAGSGQAAAISTASPGYSTSSACRQMLIYLFDYYGPVQKVQLSQNPAGIKHMYWYKKSGGIQRLIITYHNNQKQEVRLMWNPDSIRGFSFWCHQGKQCTQVPGLEKQDFILNLMAHFNNQPTHLACSTYARGGYPGKVLFNNFNGNGVDINPSKKTVFRLSGRCTITEVQTFHHNRYRGKVPGKIYIKGVDGTTGSWAFNARPGLSSWKNYYLPNANWIVNPSNLTIGPGTYEINVSDRASWSHNAQSGNAGYAIVWGKCSAAPPPTGPWVSWRGHRYQVITKATDWNTARKQAQRLGGYLVCINDADENKFARDLVKKHSNTRTYWIGLSDQGSEGRWWWVNGQPVKYTNWSGGEPNNSGGKENCAEVGWHSFYGWNDGPCGEKIPYVVEVDR